MSPSLSHLMGTFQNESIRVSGKLTHHSSDILFALLIVLLGYLFYKATAALFRKILLRSRLHDAFANLLIDNVYKTIIAIAIFILAAKQLGINITAPLAGIGIIGLAVGFAAQDSLANIIAGFMIFFDKPFRVRDFITIGDNYGRVERITMRSTRIRTQDNKYVVIPNQKIINDVLIDHSTNGDTRLIVPVSITYEASIEAARAAILAEFATMEGVLKKPGPDVVVDKLADSSVNLLARFWIADAAHERKFHFLGTEAVKKALDAAHVDIAYPHLEVITSQKKAH